MFEVIHSYIASFKLLNILCFGSQFGTFFWKKAIGRFCFQLTVSDSSRLALRL